MKLQYQLANGTWVDCNKNGTDRTDEFISRAVTMKQKIAGEWVLITLEQAIEKLNNAAELRTGTDWYDSIRCADAHNAKMAARRAAQGSVQMVKCDCGHTVAKSAVMNASLGTACPDCYDRMS